MFEYQHYKIYRHRSTSNIYINIYICIHPRLFQVESQELQKLQACGLCKWDQMYGNFEGFRILILQCVWDCGSIIYDPWTISCANRPVQLFIVESLLLFWWDVHQVQLREGCRCLKKLGVSNAIQQFWWLMVKSDKSGESWIKLELRHLQQNTLSVLGGSSQDL